MLRAQLALDERWEWQAIDAGQVELGTRCDRETIDLLADFAKSSALVMYETSSVTRYSTTDWFSIFELASSACLPGLGTPTSGPHSNLQNP